MNADWEWTADQLVQALEDATVTVLCAPEDRAAVQAFVNGTPQRDLYRVRVSPFVPAGVAYAWQPDGLLAPRALQAVWADGRG